MPESPVCSLRPDPKLSSSRRKQLTSRVSAFFNSSRFAIPGFTPHHVHLIHTVYQLITNNPFVHSQSFIRFNLIKRISCIRKILCSLNRACFSSTNPIFQAKVFLCRSYDLIAARLQSFHDSGTRLAVVYSVRRSKKQKKGDQTMTNEIITLEIEEMEEVVAPGIAMAE